MAQAAIARCRPNSASAPRRQLALVHRHSGRELRCRQPRRARERRHDRHHRAQGSRRTPGCCWRAKSITAPAMRLPSCSRSSGSRAPRASRATSPPSRAASRRLARAHALLSDRAGTAPTWVLGGEELAPYRVAEADKVEVSGPNISLLPHMAQGLGLALHELATNAAKHGALSSMRGQGQPDLAVAAGAISSLQWLETGGPRDGAAFDRAASA